MKRLSLMAVLPLLALAACGGDAADPSAPADPTSPSTSIAAPAEATPVETPVETPAETTEAPAPAETTDVDPAPADETTEAAPAETSPGLPEAPEGMVYLEGDHTGLAAAVPEDWTLLNSDIIDDPAFRMGVEDMLERTGMTEDQLRTQMQSMDFLATAPTGDNVTLLPVPGGDMADFEAYLPQLLEDIQAEVIEQGELASPVGDGIFALYEFTQPGTGAPMYQYNYWGESEQGMFNLTTTAMASAEDARELGNKVLESMVERP